MSVKQSVHFCFHVSYLKDKFFHYHIFVTNGDLFLMLPVLFEKSKIQKVGKQKILYEKTYLTPHKGRKIFIKNFPLSSSFQSPCKKF